MNTLDFLKNLLDAYMEAIQQIDSQDEDGYKTEEKAIKELFSTCLNDLVSLNPELLQLNFPDYLDDEDANVLKECIKNSASKRYSIEILPTGEFLKDQIGDDLFYTPSFTTWQNEDNPCQNFLLEYDDSQRKQAKDTLNALLLNILISLPAKKIYLNIFDFNMSGLADLFTVNLDSQLYHNEVVTNAETAHFRLKALLEHMSTVMKKYGNLSLYNNCHQEIAMPYELVILADYPNHYENYMDRLLPLFENGYKYGVYFLVLHNKKFKFRDAEQKHLLDIRNYQVLNLLNQESNSKGMISFTPFHSNPRLQAVCFEYLNEEANRKVKRTVLKQDFAALQQKTYEPIISEISVTVGLDVEDKHPVTLRFNSGDYIHAFILGQSGSGKSVLLNNIISTAIIKYSPEDLMLYLLDFKGVEFNRYQGVKHVKALLVDNSDSQMTLEVLRELKEENKKRVKYWQKEGVNNIDGYNRKHPYERLPQILFVADECQVMFSAQKMNSSEREIQREITEIINIIATQGRSQGIHMLLATQQLDETDISGQVLKNLTECFLLMSAANDSNRLVPDSSDLTGIQPTGQACYYHKRALQGIVQTFYAKDEELADVISASQEKAKMYKSNGEAYFCGSSIFYYGGQDKAELEQISVENPVAFVGRNIGMSQVPTSIELRNDYSENILFFGANREEQTVGVVVNALISLIHSYQALDLPCAFLVVDCMGKTKAQYREVLENLQRDGLIHILDRQRFGRSLKLMVEDIKNGCATPVILTILGNERFSEMKRDLPLEQYSQNEPEKVEGIEALSFSDISDLDGGGSSSRLSEDKMTYQQAFKYILDEGPMQGIHVLLQVDKPGNIFFEGDYGVNGTDKFRHKVILRSENKYLQPLRFSKDIDVEMLSEEVEHLRAYYYPENGEPQLFTPYLMPQTL